MQNSSAQRTIFALLVVLFLSPILTTAQKKSGNEKTNTYVTIADAKRVGAEACSTCHEAVVKNYQHAFHSTQGLECEDCHGAGSLHVDGGGDATKIIAFNKRSPVEADGACLSCHSRGESIRHWISGSHAANHVRCIDCHQIHQTALRAAKETKVSFDEATKGALAAALISPETNVIVRPMSETNEACLKCHPTERAQLSMPYHHPLSEGKMSCVDCHDPHGGADGRNLKTSNMNQLCLGCHAQYRGPFAYQHPPVTENCMLCHTAHGSPNTNLLSVSQPALCLQCHAGHHNGAGLPLPDRCTNCHGSIHGTDVPTPSGGSRFVDKGPSEQQLNSGFSGATATAGVKAHAGLSARSNVSPHSSVSAAHMPATLASQGAAVATVGLGGMLGMVSSGAAAPLAGGMNSGGSGMPGQTQLEVTGSSATSLTFGQYRFVDGSGYLGRVGEYDSLHQSAGTDVSQAYVSANHNITIVSRANVLTGDDYSAAAQLTVGERLQVGLFIRSFVQQQDHYQFYAFPILDVPPGSSTPPDSSTDLIPGQSVFGVTRRLGNAYARFKVPKLPVHLFVKGDWQARAGTTQLSYLDENVDNSPDTCGAQCHHNSVFQPLNMTTRNVSGGVQVGLKQFQATWEHTYSSFNDRLQFPTETFGGFFPEVEGISAINPPPIGPAPPDVPAGNYALNIPPPSQYNADRLSASWTPLSSLIFNGNVSYTRLNDSYTHYS